MDEALDVLEEVLLEEEALADDAPHAAPTTRNLLPSETSVTA